MAFVKHTTVSENTAGANSEQWATSLQASDYELLCKYVKIRTLELLHPLLLKLTDANSDDNEDNNRQLKSYC